MAIKALKTATGPGLKACAVVPRAATLTGGITTLRTAAASVAVDVETELSGRVPAPRIGGIGRRASIITRRPTIGAGLGEAALCVRREGGVPGTKARKVIGPPEDAPIMVARDGAMGVGATPVLQEVRRNIKPPRRAKALLNVAPPASQVAALRLLKGDNALSTIADKRPGAITSAWKRPRRPGRTSSACGADEVLVPLMAALGALTLKPATRRPPCRARKEGAVALIIKTSDAALPL